jgi:hypothetical protein
MKKYLIAVVIMLLGMGQISAANADCNAFGEVCPSFLRLGP